MSKQPFTAIRLAAALLAGLLARPAFGDTIVQTTGIVVKDVQIEKAGWDSISYTVSGNPQAMEGKKVLSIERSSSWLGPIRSIMAGADFKAAEEGLKKPLKDVAQFGKDWEKAEAAYLQGRFYYNWASEDPAKVGEALKALKAYLDAHKASKDFHVPPATYLLGKALLISGNAAEAQAQFKALGEYGDEKSLWGLRAKLGQAWAMFKGKNASEARKLFLEVKDDRAAPPEVRQEATIGRAETFNLQEQYDETVKLLTEAFFKPGAGQEIHYNEYYGEACNIMGDAYRSRKTKENLEEAELWYLRATCFCKAFPGAYRRAVRSLIEVYNGLGKKDRAKDWQGK